MVALLGPGDEHLALIEKAVAAGAAFIALPENAVYMGPEAQKAQFAEPLDGPTLQTFAAKAREKHVFLVVPFLETGAPEGRLYNHDAEDPDGMAEIGTTRHGELVEINRRAVALAREAAGDRAYVSASIGPVQRPSGLRRSAASSWGCSAAAPLCERVARQSPRPSRRFRATCAKNHNCVQSSTLNLDTGFHIFFVKDKKLFMCSTGNWNR